MRDQRGFRRLLTAKGLTVSTLAQAIDSDVSTVYRWFRGERRPNVEHLAKMAETLDVPIKTVLDCFI